MLVRDTTGQKVSRKVDPEPTNKAVSKVRKTLTKEVKRGDKVNNPRLGKVESTHKMKLRVRKLNEKDV